MQFVIDGAYTKSKNLFKVRCIGKIRSEIILVDIKGKFIGIGRIAFAANFVIIMICSAGGSVL